LAALGVSFAGFAGLISALDRRPKANSAVAAYRIRLVVVLGFMLTLAGFGTIALFTITGENLELTCRIASLFAAAIYSRDLLVDTRPGPAWLDERQRRVSIGIGLLLVALCLGNVAVGSVGYLQFLMLSLLLGPMTIFYGAVTDRLAGT
jgi:hypothetical protein